MVEYTVDLELKVRGDKPVVVDSLKEARRVAVNMLLGGLTDHRRYNQVRIYVGRPKPKSRAKYIVRATNYYGGKVNPYWTDFVVYTDGPRGWATYSNKLYSDGTIQRRR